MAIELRHLRYFLAVAEELHFGRAAQRLSIRQPPLSQAIRALEDELGVQLLHRTSRRVAATAAGVVFAAEARTVLASLDRAIAEARHVGGDGVTIRVGCIPHLPAAPLQRFLDAAAKQEPGWRLEVRHLTSREQVRQLRAGSLDVGIIEDTGDLDGIETALALEAEPLAAFVAPHHRLARRPVLGPGDLRDEVRVTFARELNQVLYDDVSRSLDRAGYRFAATHDGGAYPRDLLLPVARGAGVLIAPASFAQLADGGMEVVVRPLDPSPRWPARMLAWLADPSRRRNNAVAVASAAASALRG
jgi:DNA-binding transcriptional LysR family regulator